MDMQEFPIELWELIFSFVEGADLGRLCCVCSHFHSLIATSLPLWSIAYNREGVPKIKETWGGDHPTIFHTSGSYKECLLIAKIQPIRCLLCYTPITRADTYCRDCRAFLTNNLHFGEEELGSLKTSFTTLLEAEKRFGLTRKDVMRLGQLRSVVTLPKSEPQLPFSGPTPVALKRKRDDYGLFDDRPLYQAVPKQVVVRHALIKKRRMDKEALPLRNVN